MAKIKIKQVGSPIRRPEKQKKMLIGLGLGKMHRVVEIEDGAGERRATLLRAGDEAGELGDVVGAEHHVDERRLREQPLALLLRDAAGDGDHQLGA